MKSPALLSEARRDGGARLVIQSAGGVLSNGERDARRHEERSLCVIWRRHFLACIATFSPALAGPLEEGQAAYGREDYGTALQLWRPLADQGDADAQNALGDLYATRKAHVPHKEYDGDGEAAKWYRRAAEQGFAPAQSSLGRLHYLGWGVPRDLVEAARWRRRAAEQGYAEAQVWLGKNYRDGEGVPKDYADLPRTGNWACLSPGVA